MQTEASGRPVRCDEGFSLVELAVVVLVVGALAALAVPVFIAQRGHAGDAVTRSDARRVGVRLSAWYAEHADTTAVPSVTTAGGHYVVDGEDAGPVGQGVRLGTRGASPAPTDAADTTGWTATTWCVNLLNPGGSQAVHSVSAGGVRTGACP